MTTTPTRANGPSSSYLSSSSSSYAPFATHDNAGDTDRSNSISVGESTHYYFVFLALIVCAIILAIFITLRRRKRRHLPLNDPERRRSSYLHNAGQRIMADDAEYVRRTRRDREQRPPRIWGFPGDRRGDETGEEGLNEEAEAPPPYVPPPPKESGEGPAVPMQTLSREHVGLKPPDYSEEGNSRGLENGGGRGSSSRES